MISEKKMLKAIEDAKDGIIPTFLDNKTAEEIDAEANIMMHIKYLTILQKSIEAEIKHCKEFVERDLPESKTENRFFSISFVKPSTSTKVTKEGKAFLESQNGLENGFLEKTEKSGYYTWK